MAYGKSSGKGMMGNRIPMKKGGAGGIKAVMSGKGSYGMTNPTVMKNGGGTGRPPGMGPRVRNVPGQKKGMRKSYSGRGK